MIETGSKMDKKHTNRGTHSSGKLQLGPLGNNEFGFQGVFFCYVFLFVRSCLFTYAFESVRMNKNGLLS